MRKLLNSLYILEETAYLTLDGENIVCRAEDSEKFRVPFTNIEDIYIFSYSGCSPALMGKCAEYGIAVNFISPQGKFLARVQGKTKGNVYLRKEQFELFSIPQLDLIRNTVAAKLSNTRYLIRRSLHDNPDINSDGALTDCIKYLENGIKTVYETADKDIIMGIEGSCAKAYFDIFDRLILHQKEDFYLANRTKRPPLDRYIEKAVAYSDRGEMTIYVNPTDADKKAYLEEKTGFTLSISKEDFIGGIRAVIPERNILVDYAFKGALEREYQKFAFGGGMGSGR